MCIFPDAAAREIGVWRAAPELKVENGKLKVKESLRDIVTGL